MELWTVAEASEGRYRIPINNGGTPYWCMFDFAVLPAPECGRLDVTLAADADGESVEYFPHLRNGMQRGLETAREHGREWMGVRIEILKIHTHPVDTTPRGCESYGLRFVVDELPRRGVRIDDPE